MATNYPYTSDIPLATNKPSVDQPNMKINTNSIRDIIGTDHLTFATATGILTDGYHTVIHQVQQSGDPAPIANVNQIYSKSYTPDWSAGASPDTQLFNMTGSGSVSQLTGNRAIANGGWCWLGGILKIWGIVSLSAGAGAQSGSVTFKSVSGNTIPFPNNIFGVQLTPIRSTNISNNDSFQLAIRGTPVKTSFNWTFSTTAVSYTGFYWEAIGN